MNTGCLCAEVYFQLDWGTATERETATRIYIMISNLFSTNWDSGLVVAKTTRLNNLDTLFLHVLALFGLIRVKFVLPALFYDRL